MTNLEIAIEKLRAYGYQVRPARDVPGLFIVSGARTGLMSERELTMGQVVSLAGQVDN